MAQNKERALVQSLIQAVEEFRRYDVECSR